MDNTAPLTRADLDAFEKRLTETVRQSQAQTVKTVLEGTQELVLKAQAETVKLVLERTQEFVRDAQTEILRGFAAFVMGNEVRMRKMQADISNVNAASTERVDNLEQRVLAIEIRILGGELPPQG